MAKESQKIDPVGERYFRPLLVAEKTVDFLFFLSAALSLLALFVEKGTYPTWYSIVQIGFVLSVIALFSGGLLIRLYFSPRAQKRRFEDFLSHAYGTSLSHQQTKKYYNNSATTAPTRMAAQLLENCLYSRDTAAGMVKTERVKVIAYGLFWSVAILNRNTDLSAIGVAALIVFSEQIVSRWVRIEWLRFKCEQIFDDMFQTVKSGVALDLPSVKLVGEYEMVKAIASVTLSSRVFEKNEERTTREWKEIRTTLGI